MSLSSRIKRHVRRTARESRQARERREARTWRQSWLAYTGRRRAALDEMRLEAMRAQQEAYFLKVNSPGGPLRDFPGVTVHFEVGDGRRVAPALYEQVRKEIERVLLG